MLGIREQDYQQALADAGDDEERIAVLETAKEMHELLLYASLGSIPDLRARVIRINKKFNFLERRFEPPPMFTSGCGEEL